MPVRFKVNSEDRDLSAAYVKVGGRKRPVTIIITKIDNTARVLWKLITSSFLDFFGNPFLDRNGEPFKCKND